MSRRSIMIYTAALLLLVLAAFIDLPLAQFVYHPQNMIALFFEDYGYLPFLFLVPLCGAMNYTIKHQPRYLVLTFLGLLYLYFDLFVINSYLQILIVFAGLILCEVILVLFFVRFIPHQWIKKNIRIVNFMAAQLIATILIVNLVKLGWGRVRYREMDLLTAFTPWYQPNGITGHFSFPSGHTAAACTALGLTCMSKEFPKYYHKSSKLWVFAITYIIIMACTRMILGAHFLSDTVVAFLIGFTVFNCLKRMIY